MSAAHVTSAAGLVASENCRSTTLGATGAPGAACVVAGTKRGAGCAASPAWRMSRATWCRPHGKPSARSSWCTRGLP